MDGHFIRGLGDGVVESEIAPDQGALAEAELFIQQAQRQDLSQHIALVDIIFTKISTGTSTTGDHHEIYYYTSSHI